MLFSIIVPIYKVEKYLEECIQSVLTQDFSDYELILVDDGSPDGCPEIIDRYAQKDSRIRVIHKKNEGLTRARNSGLLIAGGDYIVNLDGDDRLMPHMLAHVAAKLLETHADVCLFGYATEENGKLTLRIPDFPDGVYAGDRRSGLYQRMIYDDRKPFFTFGLAPSVWTRVVRRELFSDVRFQINPLLYLGEDFATTLPIMLRAERIVCLAEPLYAYRILPGSVSHRFYRNEMRDMALMLRDFEKLGAACGQYGIRKQLGAYMVYVLFHYACALCRNAADYREYISGIRAVEPIIFSYIHAWSGKKSGKRAAVMTMAVKHKMWRMIWAYARRGRVTADEK